MALQATRAKIPVAAEILARSKSATRPEASEPIALNLAPLIAPHKKQGRVAIRVERMPQTARLSQGRNNGAGSWSLAQDELDDLAYLPPPGATGQCTLAIRIVGSEGATLALHDFHVHAGAGSAKAEAVPPKNTRNQHDSGHTRILERERDALKAKLAIREAEAAEAVSRASLALNELEELRRRPNANDVLTQAQKEWNASAQARMEAAEAQWEKRFSDAQAKAERERTATERMRSNADANELRMSRDALKNAHAEIAARDVALANAKTAQKEELARFERARDDARATAEAEWRIRKSARITAARQEWDKQADAARATLAEKCERLAAELALAREQSPPETPDGDRQKIAGLQAELAASETEIAQVRAQAVAERASWKSQSDEQLANARKEWSASAQEIPDGDRQKIAGLQAELAASETEIAQVRARAVAERASWKSQSDEQLAKARKEWSAAEASRLARAQAQWQEEAERNLAVAVARYRDAEESLAHLRSAAPQVAQDDEAAQLRGECTSLQIALAQRESELERLRLIVETRGAPTPKNNLALHADRQWGTIDQKEPERKISPVLIAQIVGVVLVAAIAVLLLPNLESSLPYDWQYEIDSTILNIEVAIGMQTPAPQATSAQPIRQTSAAQAALVDAIVAHSTKLHAKPAKSSDVLASLRRGTRVAVMETRDGWDRVRIVGNEKLSGWIPSTFLSGRAAGSLSQHGG